MRILFSLLFVWCVTFVGAENLIAQNFHVDWGESRISLGQKISFTLSIDGLDAAAFDTAHTI